MEAALAAAAGEEFAAPDVAAGGWILPAKVAVPMLALAVLAAGACDVSNISASANETELDGWARDGSAAASVPDGGIRCGLCCGLC